MTKSLNLNNDKKLKKLGKRFFLYKRTLFKTQRIMTTLLKSYNSENIAKNSIRTRLISNTSRNHRYKSVKTLNNNSVALQYVLTWKSLHIFMGIHHSSDMKTSHDHDNKLSKCSCRRHWHKRARWRPIADWSGRSAAVGARPSAFGSALGSRRLGPSESQPTSGAVGGARPRSARPPATRFHEQQKRTTPPAQCDACNTGCLPATFTLQRGPPLLGSMEYVSHSIHLWS